MATPEEVPRAIEYYSELEKVGRVVYHVSPYGEGEKPVPFNFDTSTNYYSFSFHRPGPGIVLALTRHSSGFASRPLER